MSKKVGVCDQGQQFPSAPPHPDYPTVQNHYLYQTGSSAPPSSITSPRYPTLPEMEPLSSPIAHNPFTMQTTDFFQVRPPPPSYEECIRSSTQQQPQIYQSQPPPQLNYIPPQPSANYIPPQPSANYIPLQPSANYTHPQLSANYVPNNVPQYPATASMSYVHAQQRIPVSQQPSISKNAPVVEFDPAARFKDKGAGSMVVPPPPPGCAPTPAQLAALQGQPVILKKKKKSFF